MFHLNCFTCFMCRKQLSTGEQLYVVDDNKFMCKDDYLLGKQGLQSSLTGKFYYFILFKSCSLVSPVSYWASLNMRLPFTSFVTWMEWLHKLKLLYHFTPHKIMPILSQSRNAYNQGKHWTNVLSSITATNKLNSHRTKSKKQILINIKWLS